MWSRGIRIGRVLGVPVFLAPSWLLFAGFIVLGYGPVLSDQFGARAAYAAATAMALLLGLSVLLHEVGHCVVARAFGLPVRRITVTLLAGLTEITRPPETPFREAAVAAAGPLVSLVLAGAAFAVTPQLAAGSIPHFVLTGLAVTNGVVAAFNLLPGLPLDGGRVLRAAVWRVGGTARRGTVVSAWAGRVLAVVVVPVVLLALLPALGIGGSGLGNAVFAALLSVYIYGGATAELRLVQVRGRLAGTTAGALSRPAALVPPRTPLAEAVRRAQESGAGGVVVVDAAGRPVAVLSEAAVTATPLERRPWIDAETVGRGLSEGMVLPADLAGEDLLGALHRVPASEYVVVLDGEVRILAAADVVRTMNGAVPA